MPRFGQVVIGSPGAGKSTYCRAAMNYLNSINRDAVIVNLDPAVESRDAKIDICSLVQHYEVMDELNLGPNGALVYCMAFGFLISQNDSSANAFTLESVK